MRTLRIPLGHDYSNDQEQDDHIDRDGAVIDGVNYSYKNSFVALDVCWGLDIYIAGFEDNRVVFQSNNKDNNDEYFK